MKDKDKITQITGNCYIDQSELSNYGLLPIISLSPRHNLTKEKIGKFELCSLFLINFVWVEIIEVLSDSSAIESA
jgi:hypothetical protein